MSLTRTIAHQTIMQAGSKLVSVILGIITIAALTRFLGQEGYGYYTTAISYIFFFAVFADFGLYLVTLSEIGKPGINERELFSNAFTMRLFTSLLLLTGATMIIVFFPYPVQVKQGVAIVSLSTLTNLLDQMHLVILQKHLKMHWSAIAEMTGKAVILAGTLFMISHNATLNKVFWVVVVGYAIHFTINFIAARKLLPYRLRVDFTAWKRILAQAWPVALSGIFVIIYFKADTILLSLLRPQETAQQEVGIYGAAYKVLEVLITFPSLFLGLVMPHLANAYREGDRERFQRVMQKSFDFFALITMPMIAGVLIRAEPIMILIAGKDFAISAPILRVLIIATGIIYLTHLSVYGVIATQQQKKMMPYYISAAIGAVAVYIYTIPRWSYFGAAWTTVAVELYIGLAATWLVWKKMRPIISFTVFWKTTIASIIMTAGILLFHLTLFPAIIIGGIVYIIILVAVKGFSRAQIEEIVSLRNNSDTNNSASPLA